MNQQSNRTRKTSHGLSAFIVAAGFAMPIAGSSAYQPAFGQNLPISPAAQDASAAPAVPVPATQPTVDVSAMVGEVQSNLDAKQFPAAVKAAAKVLALHGPVAASVDRFEITMQKGYAQAGMRSMSSAVITFKSAMKETKDPRQIALAKWTAELFRTAGSTSYVPKTLGANGQKRGPYDLLDTDARKDAFGALLDDDLAALDPKVKAATISQKLPEIFPVLQQIVDLDQLDLIANSTDDKTQTLASGLLDHARNLLSNALKSDWARIGDIDTHANITTTVPSQIVINGSLVTQNSTRKNGLSDSNKTELNNIISVCQKIHDAAQSFLPLAKSDKDWNTIISDSDRVAARASDVLNADYGGTTTNGSTVTDNGPGLGGTGISGTGIGNQQLGTPYYPGNTIPQQPVQPTSPPSTPTTPTTPSTPPTKKPDPTPSSPTTPATPTTPTAPATPSAPVRLPRTAPGKTTGN
jgi:hypothetical protein